MDFASQGAKALEAKDFTVAVQHFTSAISAHPHAPDYYIKRSAAYTRLSPPDYALALQDSEAGVVLARERGKRELIGQAQLRRAIALFHLQRYADADRCLSWAKTILPKDNSITIWENRATAQLDKLDPESKGRQVQAKEIPDTNVDDIVATATAGKTESKIAESSPPTAASRDNKPSASTPSAAAAPTQTPASKIRHDWYQSQDTVTLTLLAKGVPKDKTVIDIQPRSIAISFPIGADADYNFSLDPLYAAIDPSKSSYKVMSTKVEVILHKAERQKWHSLESADAVGATTAATDAADSTDAVDATEPKPKIPQAILNPTSQSAVPAYPSSSKHGPKNWDKLAEDLTKQPGAKGAEGADSDEEADPLNGFFKKLYKDADPDTRRAMMKSYQESNGTALSTNWAEVKKGPVETSPPDGMEARKWGA